MKVAVIGLWHLGLVTAACLAKANHQVIAYDENKEVVNNLNNNITPIHEPDLDELIALGTKTSNLVFTDNKADISSADIIWIAYDTPVNEDDEADTAFVTDAFNKISSFIKENTLVLFSSQIPVGSTRQIQIKFANQYPNKNVTFGYIPENLRLGKALKVFMSADRFVVGLQDKKDQNKIKELLGSFTETFVWMSLESAEMTKHALNAFLAVSVTFINEIATLCESVGADAREVESGLKSEERIGGKAYLRPGNAIAGGTLLRDIQYLNQISQRQQKSIPLLNAVKTSNHYHKEWTHRKLNEQFNSLTNKKIAVLGLTYKADTNTLRRSSAVETCSWLTKQGAKVTAFDPAIENLPTDYQSFIDLKQNVDDAINNADAIVIATEWKDFLKLNSETFIQKTKEPIIIDPSGFLMSKISLDNRIKYFAVGSSYEIKK